jgi:Zn-dependent protease with chaperone function
MTEPQGSSFFQALFDTSFREFITTRIIKVLYVLGMVLAGLGALGILIGGLSQGGAGVASIIIAPLAFILWVISLRVWLELVIVIFRIADNTDILAKRTPKE